MAYMGFLATKLPNPPDWICVKAGVLRGPIQDCPDFGGSIASEMHVQLMLINQVCDMLFASQA